MVGKYRFQEITDKNVWESFLLKHPEANFLQSWSWGQFHQKLKKQNFRIGYYKDDLLIGVMSANIEDAKRGRYLAVPGGPIMDWTDQQLVQLWRQSLVGIAMHEKCVFVRVRPQLLENSTNSQLYKGLGFRRAQMHLHAELTLQLDLSLDLEQIKQGFRKNTRYELKQAKKRQIIVTSSSNPDDIKQFYDLQLETAQRHGFVPYKFEFLQEQFRVFAADNQALLYRSETKNGELIAMAFVIFYNQEAAYHYGASTELGRSEPGAYAVQWEAIKEAKNRGLKKYNFWGIVGPEETKHRFWGVSVFKRGFKGDEIEYLHARDLVINKIAYTKNFSVEYFRKKIRKL
jgi:lipid II:glycine glycyltransferase (peptidoglycan interpeptide bridge formation enzyme)